MLWHSEKYCIKFYISQNFWTEQHPNFAYHTDGSTIGLEINHYRLEEHCSTPAIIFFFIQTHIHVRQMHLHHQLNHQGIACPFIADKKSTLSAQMRESANWYQM